MGESNYFDNLQYNSCISKGICSINPRISALQNVLVLYIQLSVKYCIKLHEKNSLKPYIIEFILNTIATSVYNPEFTENRFILTIADFKKILPAIINDYNELYNQNDFQGENILSAKLFNKCENIVDAIKFGEYIYKTNLANIPPQTRDLFQILLIITKSISINLLEIESYISNSDFEKYQFSDKLKDAFSTLLKILSSINTKDFNNENLKEAAYMGAECNTKLMELLHSEQEKRYGKQTIAKISYATTPSKAVLVVGSNIRELETILEALKNTNIDIYTHDDMMIAHTFPKFKEYKNLKGQYGHGLENCLIDFATFPGPIILTKHALHNVENLYRGRLFTTDSNYYKGMIKIENNDYSKIIESANEAKGFKTGKTCENVNIGYDYDKCIELIEKNLKSGKYKKVVVFGIKDYSSQQKAYFEKLTKLISKKILIISFSYNSKQDNLLYFNTCFDSFAVVRIVSYLLNYNIPLDIFLPKCSRNTVTEMIHFGKNKNNNVYMSECKPILINPSIINTLTDTFSIKVTGAVRQNAEIVNKL